MTKRMRLRRRQFLAASGIALAQTAIAGRATRAASAPPAPPGPQIAPPAPPAAQGVAHKPGVAPGYILSGRGENLSNPYFHPLGGPSNEPPHRPPPAHGKGVDEDDQGENQQ